MEKAILETNIHCENEGCRGHLDAFLIGGSLWFLCDECKHLGGVAKDAITAKIVHLESRVNALMRENDALRHAIAPKTKIFVGECQWCGETETGEHKCQGVFGAGLDEVLIISAVEPRRVPPGPPPPPINPRDKTVA